MSASFQPGKWMLESPQMLSSMFSGKNSNWVRMKLYFIMLPGLGMMPVNHSPWQVSHHLQLKGKEKWAPKVPGYSPPCQMAAPLQSSWARGWRKSWYHLISEASTDENSPLAPLQSLGQGTDLEKGGQELKVYISRKPILTSAVAGLVLHEEGLWGPI